MNNRLLAIVQNACQPSMRKFPDFNPGDTIKLHIKIKERIQCFQGVVIRRKGDTLANKTFTVRKISNNTPVKRIFPLALPSITKIEVIRKGFVRRAHLTYLYGRLGKAAKIRNKRH